MVILGFSLRFCSAFKNICKTRAKLKILHSKANTFHTRSNEGRSFEINFWKTLVARTRVQSARAACTFTAVSECFLDWRRFGSFWALGALFGHFFYIFLTLGAPGACLGRPRGFLGASPASGASCGPPGLSWMLLGPAGCLWASWGPPGPILGSPGRFWAFLAGPGCSWQPPGSYQFSVKVSL